MFTGHSLPEMGRDLAESALLIARGPCVCGSCLPAFPVIGRAQLPVTMADGRNACMRGRGRVLLVNNGNAAISGSAAVVLADSKFVQQQQLCVSEKLSRTCGVSVIGGHRNPNGRYGSNTRALMRPCAPARRCLARVGVSSMRPRHFLLALYSPGEK